MLNTLDFSYLEEIITKKDALSILKLAAHTKNKRENILKTGYRGYDTSIGWFNYSDKKIIANIKKAMDAGFTAMKLKVGSKNADRDIRRAQLVRETAGKQATLKVDANQQWNLPTAIKICNRLKDINLYWVEEPTHPDDVLAHVEIAKEIAPTKLALGKHVLKKIVLRVLSYMLRPQRLFGDSNSFK